MSRIITRKSILSMLIALAITMSFVGGIVSAHSASPKSGSTNPHPICSRLGKNIQGSEGLQVWCFGPQPNGPGHTTVETSAPTSTSFSSNVNAANPQEDRTPAGVQIDGQSETSIAATGNSVVEAWNDATGFAAPCGSPMNKEELIGWAFSSNGGKSFTDEGGLPNNNCNANRYISDPSVEAWRSGGTAHFYISAMYFPSFGPSGPPPDVRTHIAISACSATGTVISCSQPIIAASSSQCRTQNGFTFCSVLDKDFLTIDPVHGRLYVTFTEFGINFNPPDRVTNGQIEVAACDIGTPTGGIGPAGGTAGAPVCFNGNSGSQTSPAPPYLAVGPGDLNCENEGAYPAVDKATGDLYDAWEFNWATNIFNPACSFTPTTNVLKFVPASCLTLTPIAACGPAASNGVNVISLDATFFPGYNRFPANDFPRIAVSEKAGTVSLVWNDGRLHPLGDIFLQSFSLKSLIGRQGSPVRVNSDRAGGMHFMPALRHADANGNLNISFYQRASANTAITNVFAALGLDPLATSSPGSNTLVTTKPTNWLNVSSVIVPNFGDYTDNYVIALASAPFNGKTLYVAWSDGRTGIPQPFEANAPL